jgi:ABC-type multidrug transport system fused ATPase/permease subunit
VRGFLIPGNSLVFSAFFCLMLYFGAVFVANGEMTAGDLVTFMMFMMHFGASAGVFADYCFVRVVEAQASTTRLFAIIDRPSHQLGFAALGGVPPACQPPPSESCVFGELQFESVCFSYHTRVAVPILEDFNATVKAGSTVAFVGPSGAGKSTVFDLLQRFYQPTSGRILLDGRDIVTLEEDWLLTRIAVVQQEPVLFGFTVRENMAYGYSAAHGDAAKLPSNEAIIEASKGQCLPHRTHQHLTPPHPTPTFGPLQPHMPTISLLARKA